jgi:hypothetical protein
MATKKAEKAAEPADVKQESADPWADVKPASEFGVYDRIKVLLYGPSGAGKSRCAALFKRPLIGLTEQQAIPTIRRANPNALIKQIHTARDLTDFKALARHPRTVKECDAVVLDSLTDAQRIIRSYYTGRQSEKAGREKTSQESWGLVIDATARYARELRDLPMHVCVITLDDEATVEGTGIVHRPGVSGKRLPNDLAQYFNAVGYVHVAEQEGGLRHQVLFRGNDRYRVKGIEGLEDLEPPEPLAWIARTSGGDVPADVRTRIERWTALGTSADDDSGSETGAAADD